MRVTVLANVIANCAARFDRFSACQWHWYRGGFEHALVHGFSQCWPKPSVPGVFVLTSSAPMRANKASGRCLTMVLCLLCAITLRSSAQPLPACFTEGELAYAAGEYALAVEFFEACVQASPHRAIFHHRLGRAYGRLAEESNWLSAMGLAKRTGKAFETAVSLDDTDAQAMLDLIRFYEQAPGFLGGGEDKAAALRVRFETLCTNPAQVQPAACSDDETIE